MAIASDNETTMKIKISSVTLAGGIFAIAMGLSEGSAAEPVELRSTDAKTSLLELFTSEGCSSCPPAERWLSGLKTDSKLWKDYVIVAFHVDYWDKLGWKDPFARREFTDRQENYSSQWKTESVYTPGFVVDGKEWQGWFNREELPPRSTKKVGILSALSNKTGEWELRYQAPERAIGDQLMFSAALLGFGLNSKVGAGENSGRTLEHDFVVLTFTTVVPKHSGQFHEATLSLPANISLKPKRLGVAFWVTRGGDLQPIQAIGGWLGQ